MRSSSNSARFSGFTLIELLIVVAIIAILAAIAVPNFMDAQVRSKVSRAQADMRTIALGIQCYTLDFNRQPVLIPSNSYGYTKFYSNVLFDNGGTRELASRLTTPIAYVPRLMVLSDPFQDQRANSNTGYSCLCVDGVVKDVNLYNNFFLVTGPSPNYGQPNYDIFCTKKFILHGANGPVKQANLVLYSVGPSKDATNAKFRTGGVYSVDSSGSYYWGFLTAMFGQQTTTYSSHYDPTNGTRSLGMIARFE